MVARYVQQPVSDRGVDPPSSGNSGAELELVYRWAERLTSRLNLEFLKALSQTRAVVNAFVSECNDGTIQIGQGGPKLTWGTGAPTLDPGVPALYIRMDGGANTTLYVWEGAAWASK